MDSKSKIFVAGHKGLVGSAIKRRLEEQGYENVYYAEREFFDLRDRTAVDSYFNTAKPDYVFLAAAKVGGIIGNKNHKAEFIYDNLMIQSNVIDAAYRNGVKKFMFLGSSCIYPKHAEVPIKEDQLLTDPLEPTNDAYAIAKIAGIKMCESYREQYGFQTVSVLPCNLYGVNDNFHPENSHVIPGMMRKFVEAEGDVTLWGDGTPMREFLYVDDLADACIFLMDNYFESDIINVGTGEDITIKELAETIADVVEYKGKLKWDTTKPNGTMRKVMDVSKIKSMGWEPKVSLKEGLERTYEYFKNDRV